MQSLIEKADVLVEALPYMRRFVGKTIIIKYGGHAMTDDSLRASFAVDVVLLKFIGLKPVIVHGGGPQIAATLDRLGMESTFVEGLRVTDDETMDVVEMVLGGKVNREVVDSIQRAGGRSVGLTGSDGALLQVCRKQVNGKDIGRVGEIVEIDPRVLDSVSESGFIPVIAPIGVDRDGLTYNVNADEAAGGLASALESEKLMLLTDVEGVLDSEGTLISQIKAGEVEKYFLDGTITGGMIPKVRCCVDALEHGVSRAHIVDGRVLHAVLLEIFTDDAGVGTLLTP
ncbi:MAG: acetylglutamate kinase [Myxococcota bacterium]|jgi:acetylglutamate kinase|nr:acetylglutamate kinase [Myxococcota bacterium]